MSQLLLGLLVLMGGGLLALLVGRSARLANTVGAVSAVAGSAFAFLPVLGVLVSGKPLPELSWAWNVPFGSFAIALDPLSAWFAGPILGLAILAAVYGAGYLAHYADHKSLGPPWFFYNLLVAAMVLVVVARNGMLFLMAWEGMALTSYFLVVFEDEKGRVRAAGRIYLIASHVGTAFLLLFFAILLSRAGSLDFSIMAKWAGSSGQANRVLTGTLFLLALIGFGTVCSNEAVWILRKKPPRACPWEL